MKTRNAEANPLRRRRRRKSARRRPSVQIGWHLYFHSLAPIENSCNKSKSNAYTPAQQEKEEEEEEEESNPKMTEMIHFFLLFKGLLKARCWTALRTKAALVPCEQLSWVQSISSSRHPSRQQQQQQERPQTT